MATEEQLIEEFAGQRLLHLDPRSEKPLRVCPACSSHKARKVGIKNELEIVKCQNCRSLYCPYMPWYTSERYYVDYYSHHGLDEPPVVIKRLKEITRGFSKHRQTNRLLDVGCGGGLLLEAARENGWDALGIDVSISSVEHVRNLGFEVFHGELKDVNLDSEQFDVISAAEIVEHLFDPLTVLKEAHRLLRPGGLLWITTPHANSLAARLMKLDWKLVCPPEHLQLFSVRGLRTLLRQAGFQKVRFETTGVNPAELWQSFGKPTEETSQKNFDAVQNNYRLNEAMTRSSSRRVLKYAVNSLLNISKLGESLKAYAIR